MCQSEDRVIPAQGGSPASNVVQTPTYQAVAEAEAELSPSGPTLLSSFSRKLQRPRQTSVEFSLAEPAPRQKSLVGAWLAKLPMFI